MDMLARCSSSILHRIIFVTSLSPLVLCYCHLLFLIVHLEVAIRTLLTRWLHRGFRLLFLSSSILLSLSSLLVPACICLTTFHSTSLTFTVCLSHSALLHLLGVFLILPKLPLLIVPFLSVVCKLLWTNYFLFFYNFKNFLQTYYWQPIYWSLFIVCMIQYDRTFLLFFHITVSILNVFLLQYATSQNYIYTYNIPLCCLSLFFSKPVLSA